MAKSRRQPDASHEVHVRLKPFLGMRPGVYLTILYGLIVCTILFFLLFYPGIRYNGSLLIVNSTPGTAAVYVDGDYAGPTPLRIFVSKGERTIQVKRPFFTTVTKSERVRGRIFGSLFVKRKLRLSENLSIADFSGLLSDAFSRQSQWALIDKFGTKYQPKMVVTNAVESVYKAAGDKPLTAAQHDQLNAFLYKAMENMSNETMLADVLRGLLLASSDGKALTAGSLLSGLNEIIHLKEKWQNLPLLAVSVVDSNTIASVYNSDWFKSYLAKYRSAIQNTNLDVVSQGVERNFDGLPFVQVPTGTYLMGVFGQSEDRLVLPHPVRVGSYWMLKSDVTRGMYQRFLAADPKWKPENRDSLVSQGLVTSDYLLDWNNGASADLPVRYVSYYAAKAFAAWFQSRLASGGGTAGYTVGLPTEEQWEWAAVVTQSQNADVFTGSPRSPHAASSGPGIRDLMGSVWQWCNTWYYPAAYYVSSWTTGVAPPAAGSTIPFSGSEMVVRGGSWANMQEDHISISTRGSQPPAWCTAFTGFRVVLTGAR